MASSLSVDIEGIGPLLFERSRRARRVSISVKAFRGVRVAVPLRISFGDAMEFVRLKKPWIKKHLEAIRRHETESKALAGLSAGIDSAKARKQLTGRLNRLAQEHGFTFNKVYIRRQRTRWGSCSRKGNISLNVKLVLLPEELADYVILHELVHTRIQNHARDSGRSWTSIRETARRRLQGCGSMTSACYSKARSATARNRVCQSLHEYHKPRTPPLR